jgi:uncharacterized protein (DUF1697 family)
VSAWVALLRGINVGTAKPVPMDELRAAAEAVGATEVQTVLRSGNVAARGPVPEAEALRAAVRERTGVDSAVVVLGADELRAAVAANPLEVADPSRFLVGVLLEPARDRAALEEVAAGDWAPEAIALGDRVVFLALPGGVHRSRLMAAVERAAGGRVTARNWRTVTRLLDLCG